jgi:hypothetical protein
VSVTSSFYYIYSAQNFLAENTILTNQILTYQLYSGAIPNKFRKNPILII